jgi:hypothetical protein
MFVPHVVRMLLIVSILLYKKKWLLFYILRLFSQLWYVIVKKENVFRCQFILRWHRCWCHNDTWKSKFSLTPFCKSVGRYSQFAVGGGWNARSHNRHKIKKRPCTLPLVLVVGPLNQCGFSNMPSTKWHGLVGSSTLVDFFFICYWPSLN